MDNGDISEPIFQMLSVNRWPCMHPLLIVQYVTTLKTFGTLKGRLKILQKTVDEKSKKKLFLKKISGKYLCWSLFLIKLQSSRLQLY